jgi:surface protein
MFFDCYKFNSDLSNWDVSNGENFERMFYGCESFDADLSRWNTTRARYWLEFAKGSLLAKYPERIPERFRDDYLKTT